MRKSFRNYQTYKVTFNDDTYKTYWVKDKKELLDYITAREFLQIKEIIILNKVNDNVKHRPIKVEDLY